ncbi:hypothetical protein [Ralstonia chuxiongensis]|uniref:hypothetical protein n=1 Tax=Ralstonia chuxiongensis TaxID=2957504 RepID=UPI0028F59458|nr:hypothetical protein [Ralstonia chuxiongensis]CAJ0777758.1 hypothetical protein R8510_04406 [Ralstonia chuxiongensis]
MALNLAHDLRSRVAGKGCTPVFSIRPRFMLDGCDNVTYSGHVAETSVNGRRNPDSVGGQPPQCGIFYVRLRTRAPSLNGGPGGAAAGLAGANCRFSTPASARRPHVEMNGGPQLQQLEAFMRHSSCLTRRPSGQTQPILSFSALDLIRAAARSALHAPTPEESADIAFAALVRLDGGLRGGASVASRQFAACAGQFHIGARYPEGWLVGVNSSTEAVILLPGDIEQVTWTDAMEWAREIGGQLPTRAEAALLHANFPQGFARGRFWTSDQCVSKRGHFSAWYQSFSTGNQAYKTQRMLLKARAIRRMPLDEFLASLNLKAPDPFVEQAPATQGDQRVSLDRVLRAEVAHG